MDVADTDTTLQVQYDSGTDSITIPRADVIMTVELLQAALTAAWTLTPTRAIADMINWIDGHQMDVTMTVALLQAALTATSTPTEAIHAYWEQCRCGTQVTGHANVYVTSCGPKITWKYHIIVTISKNKCARKEQHGARHRMKLEWREQLGSHHITVINYGRNSNLAVPRQQQPSGGSNACTAATN